MVIKETSLSNVYLIEPKVFFDERGVFIKTFNETDFENCGIESNFKESFYSESKKNVIRGMHFQLPPHDQAKLVYVPYGIIIDVVLDIRKSSPTYGESFSVELSRENRKAVYIPPGFAHGFASSSEDCIVVYMTTTTYQAEYDSGIRWDSFGYHWQINNPIISKRDQSFIKFSEFESPF